MEYFIDVERVLLCSSESLKNNATLYTYLALSLASFPLYAKPRLQFKFKIKY